jgi:hypothetical protein
MAYATTLHMVLHHQARATYNASTIPNASAAAMFLDEAAAQIDFALTRGGYDSPLVSSAPSSVKTLIQKANAYGALAMSEASAQQSHNAEKFQAMFKEALKMMEQGQLPGMDRNSEESRPRFGEPATPTAAFFLGKDY